MLHRSPYSAAVALCAALSIVAAGVAMASQYGKNTIAFPSDPFAVPSANGEPGWVKFLILTDSPDTVWFQDTNHFPFHYDFASSEFLQFSGMTPEQFDDVTLYEQGQQAILGAVILPPLVGYDHVIAEYGIQLARRDPYDPIVVRDVFNLVRSVIVADPGVQAFYFPSFEQQATAEQNRDWFASQGLEVGSVGRWADGNACYSEGWALGELKYVEAGQIESAYVAGTLGPGDILLTDAVPAEIPYLAGVLSLSPSTPNSHVAILAETFGVPFSHLALAGDAQRAQDLLGHRVALRVERDFEGCRVRLIDVEGVLDPATIDEILALKDPPVLTITPVQAFGSISASTDGLQLADIRYFGGKAANFGTLRRALPANSPVAVAFSFDLWTSFMDQLVTGGITLRQEIAQQLSVYSYPPDMTALSATLSSIRDLIKDSGQTAFTPGATAAVLAALQDPQYGFDPNVRLRFRSSTNVEDSDQFTGAGLYDSFSGCLADELDGDSQGPSLCEPQEPDERGVFRAIRKVFASFYNLNAFVERLRHGIDENEVGMALLSHHSFADADELANGVGTLRRTSATDRGAYLVSQAGASSVTNPEPGAIAEEVDVSIYTFGIFPTLMVPSNLVQLGATVMEFTVDYEQLTQLLLAVGEQYATESGLGSFTLEFEYKKLAVGQPLIVKQVRRIPPDDDTPSVTPLLIDEPTQYCVYQGEASDVFANHRLKSRWNVQTESLWLTPANLLTGFFGDVTMDYTEVCQQYTLSGQLSQWPGASHLYAAGTAVDGWTLASLQNPREESLTTQGIPELVAPSESPLLTLRDLGVGAFNVDGGCLQLEATYDRPVPTVDWTGPVLTQSESVLLCPCLTDELGDRLQQRILVGGDGTTVTTTFYWPAEPGGIVAGYTAPATRFVETVIQGLTSTPIVLQGEYSQTYRPEHHNFGENFLFEPALEPGIPQLQLDELASAGVRTIHAVLDFSTTTMTYYDDTAWGDPCLGCTGFDGDRDGWCTESPSVDCDDQNAEVWSPPGEAPGLLLPDKQTLAWSAPIEGGGSSTYYDTLRAGDAADLWIDAVCVESDDGSDLQSTDVGTPAAGEVFYYLVRAQNDCPSGEGPLGTDSQGTERLAPSCP